MVSRILAVFVLGRSAGCTGAFSFVEGVAFGFLSKDRCQRQGAKDKGIIEDTSPYELLEIVKYTDQTGKMPKVAGIPSCEERDWDYRAFDLECCNVFLKGEILHIQYAYEAFE